MKVTVFCAASAVDEKYVVAAHELAQLIGERGHALVWGGSSNGLMKVMAEGVKVAGGRITGVTVEFLKEYAHKDAHEMIVAKTLGERRAALLERGDALIVLPGGLGTLDEATEVLELKKHKHHDKKVVILNSHGFYDGLKQQLERIEKEGFLMSTKHPRPLSDLVRFADTPGDAMRLIESAS
jgi:uncharacterized protein (TIGR00730 family)